VGKEAKDESSKGFSPVNRARTGHEAYNITSYMMMMIMMMITMTILI
jgi:hypothetical protein